jgi:hypothetical protein
LDPSAQRAAVDEERRNRRLARNRASARLRRQRKKGLVDAFEADVALLELTLQQLQRHRWGTSGLHRRPPPSGAPPSGRPGGVQPTGPLCGGQAFGDASQFVDLAAALAVLDLSGAAADLGQADRDGADDADGSGASSGRRRAPSSEPGSEPVSAGRPRGAAGAALWARQEAVHCTRGHLIEAMALPELLKAAAATHAAAAAHAHAHAHTASSPGGLSSSGSGSSSSSSSSSDALAGLGDELLGLLHLSREQYDQLLSLSPPPAATLASRAANGSFGSSLANASRNDGGSSSHSGSGSSSSGGGATEAVSGTVADDVLELAVLNKCLEALRSPRWQEQPTLEGLQAAWQQLLAAPQQAAFARWLRRNADPVAALDLAAHPTQGQATGAQMPRFVFDHSDRGGLGGGGFDDEDGDHDSDSWSHQHSSSNSLGAAAYHSSSNSLGNGPTGAPVVPLATTHGSAPATGGPNGLGAPGLYASASEGALLASQRRWASGYR